MNHFKQLGIIALAGLALAGCGEEAFVQTGEGQGTLRVVVDVNQSLLTSRSARATASSGVVSINEDDLILQLSRTDGSWSKSWEGLSDLNSNSSVPSGTYIMEAFYGSTDSQGFESPYFYGVTEVTVKTGETTEAGLNVALANAMMTINFGDDMGKYLTNYSAELQCAGVSEPVIYTQGESRPAYVTPGQVSVYVNVTKPSGTSGRLLAGTVQVEARHHYFVKINMNESENSVGDGKLVVEFDDSFVTDDYEVDLSDELLDAPAPQVTPAGFTDGQLIEHYAQKAYANDLRFDIFAPGRIGTVMLNTTNAQAINAQWPEQVDLMKLSAAQQEMIKSLGLNVRGLWQKPGELATVDFAGLIGNIDIPKGQEEVEVIFSITVVDKYGKTNEETPSLKVRVVPKFGVNVQDAWATKAYFVVYDKGDHTSTFLKGVSAEISANDGPYEPVTVAVQPDGHWQITGLQPSTNYSLIATLDGISGKHVNFVTESADQLPNSGLEDWHTVDGQTSNWWVEYPWKQNDENHAWDTLNKLTTSDGGNNTGVFSNHNGCSYCAYSGTRETTDCHSGSKAAVIETVGWGSGNTAAGGASILNHFTPGELYLGSYDESSQAGNYGIPFETRPTAIEFYYKYTPKNEADYGTVIMEVVNDHGDVIGSTGVVALAQQSAYTLKSVPIAYTDIHSKAKTVRVVFKSTVGDDGTHNFLSHSSDNINYASVNADSRHYGSSLYIDDINLAY